MIRRALQPELRRRLHSSAAVVLLGPRQVGKTTMARAVMREWESNAVYLDLERPADRRRLDDADVFLRAQAPRLVVLDEVHRMPELFQILRGVIDDNRANGFRFGQFLLLGSASLDLIAHAGESLAGRVAHLDLASIDADEAQRADLPEAQLWLRGGFPDSLLAADDVSSMEWRSDLIRSYLERDVPMFAPRLPAETLRRLWTMLAHTSGGLFNASRLASGLGVSGPTVDRYVDLLANLGLVRRLLPWHANLGKRLTKAQKVFVRDTGILHSLLEVETMHELLGHPAVGPSFESLAVESLISAVGPRLRPYHFRTARGDEIDLLLVVGGVPAVAIEVKRSTSPQVSPGYFRAVKALEVPQRYVVHPQSEQDPYTLHDGTVVVGLSALAARLRAEYARL